MPETIDVRTTKYSAYTALDALLQEARTKFPTGVFHVPWLPQLHDVSIADFDGDAHSPTCSQHFWQQCHLELFNGDRDGHVPSPEDTDVQVAAHADLGMTPIFLSHLAYRTPSTRVLAKLISTTEKGEELPSDLLRSDKAVLEREAVLASALLPPSSVNFDFRPPVHDGLTVRYVLPEDGYITNLQEKPSCVEIDFDDGNGYRAVNFEEPIEISYPDAAERCITLRISSGENHLTARFSLALRLNHPPVNAVWELTGTEAYAGVRATGTAWVFLGRGNRKLTRPVIFADGFGEGRSSLGELWETANKSNLLTRLLGHGKDIILVGYSNKSDYVQRVAFVIKACLQRAIKERAGTTPFVVGGGSMGALAARYALRQMEHAEEDHQCATYVSFDGVHVAAWFPLSIQATAHYFAPHNEDVRKAAKLLSSVCAQQLLYAWMPRADYRGDVGNNAHKRRLHLELRNMGGFPRKPKKLALANGRGDGSGNGARPGELAFDFHKLCADCKPRIQNSGENVEIIYLRAGLDALRVNTSNVNRHDSAPGGTNPIFGTIARALNITANYADTCFVPTISALSFGPLDLYQDLRGRTGSSFDEYKFSSDNTVHVEITEELAAWVVGKLTADDLAGHGGSAAVGGAE